MRFSKGAVAFFCACVLILILPPHSFDSPFAQSDTGCDGCSRSAFIASLDTNAGSVVKESIRTAMWQVVNTPCFRIKASQDPMFKPSEYLFRVEYFEKLEDKIKSRMSIRLYYNGPTEELVKTWSTETDNPDAKYIRHKRRMFTLDDAELKRSHPMELTVLNDFEKRPYSCELEVPKDLVLPDEEVEIELRKIHDIEGRPSREFNRIVIQALEGRILGGQKLAADPGMKAFQVGDGKVKFKYKAPRHCTQKEDTIFIYNSCDILRKDLYPLSKTEPKDKIAEETVSCISTLAVECVWATDVERFPEFHLRWGGKAHFELELRAEPAEINDMTYNTLKGSGSGSQECWVKVDRPHWIENVRYSGGIEVYVDGGPPWLDELNFLIKTDDPGLSWDEVETRAGTEYRWPGKDRGLRNILANIIFAVTLERGAVFRIEDKDMLGTEYELTARWIK